jgi:hypothetical protein
VAVSGAVLRHVIALRCGSGGSVLIRACAREVLLAPCTRRAGDCGRLLSTIEMQRVAL